MLTPNWLMEQHGTIKQQQPSLTKLTGAKTHQRVSSPPVSHENRLKSHSFPAIPGGIARATGTAWELLEK